MSLITRYAKAITAAIGAVAVLLTALNISAPWVSAIIAAATALGVYAVPNTAAPPAASPAPAPGPAVVPPQAPPGARL